MDEQKNKIMSIFLILLIIPIALGIFFVRAQTIDCNAYAITNNALWSLYFDPTNKQWYNVTSGYVTSNLYDQRIHAFDSPVINGYQSDDVYFIGITNASFTGHNVTSIRFQMARYVDEFNPIEPTGNIQVGVFQNNSLTYTLRQTFGLFNVATLIQYDGINWDTVIGNYASGYVMQSGDIIGFKANGVGHVGTRSGLVIQVQRFSDGGITDSSIYVFNDGNVYIHGGASANPNFYGYVKESSYQNTMTKMSLGSGYNPSSSLSVGAQSCMFTTVVFFIVPPIAIASLIISLVAYKKSKGGFGRDV